MKKPFALSGFVKQQKLSQATKQFHQEDETTTNNNTVSTSSNNKALLFDIGTFALRAGTLQENNHEPILKDQHSWIYKYDISRGFAKGIDENKRYFGIKTYESSSFISYPIFKTPGAWLSNLEEFPNLVREMLSTKEMKSQFSSLENQPFLLSGFEALNGQVNSLNKFMHTIFEDLKINKFSFQEQTKCQLASKGLQSGIVINIGYGTNYCISYLDGKIKSFVENHELNGNYLTDIFVSYMNDRDQYVDTRSDRIKVMKAKDNCSFIRLENDVEEVIEPIDYQLPDGKFIHLDKERYEAYESLFDPKRITLDVTSNKEDNMLSLTEMIKQLNVKEKSILENIVLSGGVGTVKNLDKRLFLELDKSFDNNVVDWNIKQSNDVNDAYRGLSMLAQLSSFEECYLTKQMYDEEGENVYIRHFPRIKQVDEEVVEERIKESENKEREEILKDSQPEEQKEEENKTTNQQKEEKKDDFIEQLKKLKELKDAGILTDEEFQTKKNKILGL
ncbi:hypothetical protein ABK040_007120 [Willaertia magna]